MTQTIDIPLIGGRVALNVRVRDVATAKAAMEIAGGACLFGFLVREYSSVDAAVEAIQAVQASVDRISVGLGEGDPTQWRAALEVAVRTRPVHLNQPFACAGYSAGYLRGAGNQRTVVNALVNPGSTPGKVIIATGPAGREWGRRQGPTEVPAEEAMAYLRDASVFSVKLFPLRCREAVHHVRAVARAAASAGIPLIEPTGGITPDNLAIILEAALAEGVSVMPHLYGALLSGDGELDIQKFRRCVAIARTVTGKA
ncbi:KDGP aldolase [Geochorda subterranea]|uniref:KDGP aldolase n=1 Tax=Geochorda subterranea TaxID=3109564 RepID=A0ABZ1BRC1_9FIRM|nr:KDGP aldolase [Limnochorda sp. LNt]WRP15141.1 KDGP aldolase [Limnochorda sp. LNt]